MQPDASLPIVTVEFYGVPRLRAGLRQVEVRAVNLGEAIEAAGRECPGLRGSVVEGRRLLPSFRTSINGLEFANDPATPLRSGDHVLLISADAGG